MTSRPPDFDELVADDLEPPERERLHRVHDLLVSAGPPPELSRELTSPELRSPPRAASVHVLRQRRRRALAALAAALAAAVFVLGFVVGDRSDNPGVWRVIEMNGVGGASASLEIFDLDDAGNWPMELEVEGLDPSGTEKLYELWLTKDGELAASCGRFAVEADGTTTVPLNAPYRLSQFDDWVVVEEGSDTPLLTT